MSLFRRPKKPMQPRVFSGLSDEEANTIVAPSTDTRMDVDDADVSSTLRQKSSNRAEKKRIDATEKSSKKSSLLSFDDEGKQ